MRLPYKATFMVLTQKKVYAQQMGGESCGRLRFVVLHLDPDQVRKVPFEERLVPRNKSQEILVETLREILLAQQCLPDSEPEHFARQYPTGLDSEEMKALWDSFLVSRFAPLAKHLHSLANPTPTSLVASAEAEPAESGTGRAKRRRTTGAQSSAGCTVRMRGSAQDEGVNGAEEPKRLPALSIEAMQFSPAGTMIMAGIMDGTNVTLCSVGTFHGMLTIISLCGHVSQSPVLVGHSTDAELCP